MDLPVILNSLLQQVSPQLRQAASAPDGAASFGQALSDRAASEAFNLPDQVSALLGNSEPQDLAIPIPSSLGSELAPAVNGQTLSTAGLDATGAAALPDVFSIPATGPVTTDPTGSSLFQSFAGSLDATGARLEGPLQQAILLQVTGIQAAAPGGAYTQGQAPQAGQPNPGEESHRRPVLAAGEFAATYNQWRQQVLRAPLGLSVDVQG